MFIRTSSSTAPKTLAKATHSTPPKSQPFVDRLDKSVAFLSRGEMDFHQLGRRFKPSRNHSSGEVEQNKFGELTSTFPGRNGYDENFLGKPLNLPTVDPSERDKLATLIGKPGETELTYTNFSVVMQKERRQPIITAVNPW